MTGDDPTILRKAARRLLPRATRRWLRGWISEYPERLRDLPLDLRDALTPRSGRRVLPPPAMRGRVGRTRSRREFETVGCQVVEDLVSGFERSRRPEQEYPRWLDFGCGSGRVAMFLAPRKLGEIYGVDIDRGAIRWAQRNLGRDHFKLGSHLPPLPFADSFFDVVFAISVFTHLDERMQDLWLAELQRVLRPQGLLIASSHSQELLWTRPDLDEPQRSRLATEGFLFAPGQGKFNDDSTFHTLEYLDRVWGQRFTRRLHVPLGFAAFQDLSAWESRKGTL